MDHRWPLLLVIYGSNVTGQPLDRWWSVQHTTHISPYSLSPSLIHTKAYHNHIQAKRPFRPILRLIPIPTSCKDWMTFDRLQT